MLNDPPPKETAEEKAQRYWRNNALIRHITETSEEMIGPITPTQNNHLRQLLEFKRDLRELILTRPTQALNNYLISIQAKKNRLLREKLRRLERDNECEL